MTETGGGAVIADEPAGRAMSVSAASGAWIPGDRIVEMFDRRELRRTLVRQKGDDPRRGFFSDYLKDESRDRRGVARRVVPHRRRRAPRATTATVLRRPQEEHRAPLGREHRGDRGRRRRSTSSTAVRQRRGRAGAGRDARRGGVRADRAARAAEASERDRRARSHAPAPERLAYSQGARATSLFVDAASETATQKLQRGASSRLAAAIVGAPDDRPARPSRPACASARKRMRAAYDGVVIAAPVTVPYVRYSTRDAHWWLAPRLAISF